MTFGSSEQKVHFKFPINTLYNDKRVEIKYVCEPWAEVLVSEDNDIASVDIAKARGFKCERCKIIRRNA